MTLEQIVATHPCPIIRAKIMENVATYLTSVEKYNLKSIVVYGIENWRNTKEGYKFWNAVDDNYTAPYSDLKHLDNSYVPETALPPVMWRKIDKDNLPDEPVLAGDKEDFSKCLMGYLQHDKKQWYELKVFGFQNTAVGMTHYIPLSDLINLPQDCESP